jgi:hypothetical protein
MFLIHSALGEDAKIFDIDEEPSPSGLYSRIQQNPDQLESESFYTKALKDFEEIKEKHPDLVKSLDKFPPRIKVAKNSTKNELLVIVKKQRLFVHHILYGSEENNHFILNLDAVYENIKTDKEDPPIPLSNTFWDEYEHIKKYKVKGRTNTSENSLLQKAINNLKYFLKVNNNATLTELKDFIRMLLEDIIDYGTLSDYTLRRISGLNIDTYPEKTIRILQALKRELGSNYLYDEKQKLVDLTKEIIIAIENQIPINTVA